MVVFLHQSFIDQFSCLSFPLEPLVQSQYELLLQYGSSGARRGLALALRQHQLAGVLGCHMALQVCFGPPHS